MAEVRIGCSGFNYAHWKGNFYPSDLPQRRWFEYYCTLFASVELNVTFYRVPLVTTFEKWYRETPPDFAFSLKGSRFITHVKRLLNPEESLALFLDRAQLLKEKLRVVLWQFSPAFKADIDRLGRFLALLDRYPVRNTFEFRNESWINDRVFSLCKEHNASLCVADWPPFLSDVPATADFVYIRRHGEGGDYTTDYSKDFLKREAGRTRNYLKEGKDVFIYFNNDFQGHAPKNARELREMLKT